MSLSYSSKRQATLAALDEDFSINDINKKDPPSSDRVSKTTHLKKDLFLFSMQVDDGDDESPEIPCDNKEERYSDSSSESDCSLVAYFKAINKFPLLSEKDETIFAKNIKENEKVLRDLVIEWVQLFEKKFLRMFPAKQVKEVSEKIQSLNGSFYQFDGLIKCEMKQKKVLHSLKRVIHKSKDRLALQREVYTVEAEISKCISEISFNKTVINKVIRYLKKPLNKKINTRKQQIVVKELRETLRRIDDTSKKIKIIKNELIQSNLRFVISTAIKYSKYNLSLTDLIQEGNLGLIRAINTYDYRRGNKFITYATWWIRQSIIRALDNQSRTIRAPVYINDKLNQIVKASNRLRQEHGREPTLEEIAGTTNVPLKSVETVLISFKDYLSFDDYNREDLRANNAPMHHESISTLKQVSAPYLSQALNKIIMSDLTQREKKIIKLRFGIGEKYDHTLEEIAQEFNLSRERIRQILEVALTKLRNSTHIIRLEDFKDCNR